MDNFELGTERLVVRRFKESDGDDLYEYLSNPEVVQFEPYEVFDKESAYKEAVRRSGDESFYAVCLADSGKLIGNLYFEKQDFGIWELGYVFNLTYQKHGYATESAKALVSYGFEKLGMRKVIAMANPLNPNSWHLMERLGMRREAQLRKNIYFKYDKNGEPLWSDTYIYGMFKDEYEN